MSTTLTIITAIVGSSAVATLIQFFVNRHDSRADAIAAIRDDLHALRAEFERGRAISARIRILSASDEVMHGEKHSQEWWDQVLDDCSFYEIYCHDHKDFKNKKAVHATEHLSAVYSKVYESNSFI